MQQGREGLGLLALLPGRAAAVALQRVVDDVVVVGVLPRQYAGPARAAQWAGHELVVVAVVVVVVVVLLVVVAVKMLRE